MNLRRLTGLLGVLSYLVVPVSLFAQVAGGVEIFGALDNSDPVTRTLGGLSLSVGTPYLGIRGSGGLGISSPTVETFGTQTGSDLVWATNADLVLGPVNAGLGEGFMPYTDRVDYVCAMTWRSMLRERRTALSRYIRSSAAASSSSKE